MPKSLLAILVLALVALVLKPAPARADSWGPPQPADYLSANGNFRFHVEPGPCDAMQPDPAEGQKPAPRASTAEVAVGTLAKKGADGKFADVWSKELVNKVGPVDVLVADDGSFVVTFDDWGSIGTGKNVVVIYDAAGKKIAGLELKDFLTADEMNAVPKSVSSLMWYSEPHALDLKAGHLILKTAAREVKLELATGKAIPPEKK